MMHRRFRGDALGYTLFQFMIRSRLALMLTQMFGP